MKRLLILAIAIFSIGFGLNNDVSAQKVENVEKQQDSNWRSSSRTLRITRPGNYRLFRSRTVRSGDGIVISASNVTLDLNGNTVSTRSRGNGRGIVIDGGKNVVVRNGKVNGFALNVGVLGGQNVKVDGLQITGDGLAPDGGPSEIGIMLVNTKASRISNNAISSVNLGIFVRGGGSTGNAINGNVITGGAVPSYNIFGICYNPAAGEGDAGPRGDNVFQNTIARFGFALSVSSGSVYNTFRGNNLAGFNGGIADTSVFRTEGGTNVSLGNVEHTLPADTL